AGDSIDHTGPGPVNPALDLRFRCILPGQDRVVQTELFRDPPTVGAIHTSVDVGNRGSEEMNGRQAGTRTRQQNSRIVTGRQGNLSCPQSVYPDKNPSPSPPTPGC